MGLLVWKADPTSHVPHLPALSRDRPSPRGSASEQGYGRRPCVSHTQPTCWGARSPREGPSGCPDQEVGGSQETQVTPPACRASTSDSSGSALDLGEPRPQSSKTHVYFTRNLIHLVLICLHLTHQMQFCKSRSMAKGTFRLSLPSERSLRSGRAGASAPGGQEGVLRVGG